MSCVWLGCCRTSHLLHLKPSVELLATAAALEMTKKEES